MTPETFFLSYSRADEAFALRFAQDLQRREVAVWVDQIDIRPSEHWDRAIERAVRECRGLIVLLSPRSVASDNVADEISFAIESGKKVLPILVERCTVPLRVTRMHLIDATRDYDKALNQCVTEMRLFDGLAPSPAAPAPVASLALTSPDVVAGVERRLTAILGPIARVLVARAADAAATGPELYHRLADAIADEGERARFLEAAPSRAAPGFAPGTDSVASPDPAPIPAGELKRLGELLTHYLGPIAPMVVNREGRASASLDELHHRLSSLIPAEPDRRAFLLRVGG